VNDSSPEANPYWVLELTPRATSLEIERAAQKLLGLLEIGSERARTYPTPWGRRSRDTELVRASLAVLRDPAERIVVGFWFIEPESASGEAPRPAIPGKSESPNPQDVFAAVGWRGRCTS
jgi:hypothetical protein